VTEETPKSYSPNSFWKTNLPTRNILIVLLTVHVALWITTIIITIVQGLAINFDTFYEIPDYLIAIVGQSNDAVFNGHVYQLITSIFVHFNWLHILSNCLFLLIFGLKAEDHLLDWQYYALFIISGFMGGLISLSFGSGALSAGASGGVFGLLGADIIIIYQTEKDKKLWVYLGIGVIFLGLTAGAKVNVMAHAIGLLTGFLFPVIFKKRKDVGEAYEISA